jgi:hypothetical protein
LNGRFLIGGKHHRMLRRVQIQPNDVGRFLLEIGIVGQHVAFDAMGLQAGAAPDTGHEHVTDAEHLRQLAGAPVRTPIGWALSGLGQHARFQRRCSHARGLPAILRPQSGQPLPLEPLFPAADVIGVAPHRRHDRGERRAVSQHQNDLSATGIFRADLATPQTPLKFGAFIGSQCQRHTARSIPLVIQW